MTSDIWMATSATIMTTAARRRVLADRWKHTQSPESSSMAAAV